MLPLPLGLRRVVDLTRSIAGASTSRWLGDFGAEVIAVERPAGPAIRETSPLQMRNKLSCQIDPETAEGRDLCLRLAATSDVVLVDRDDEALRASGIDYTTFAALRSDIIVVSIGDGANRPGVGVIAAAAALTALFHHRVTGQGQHVNVEFPLSRASMTALPIVAASAGVFDAVSPDLPVSGVYVCGEGRVAVCARSLEDLAGLGEAIGRPELADALSGGVELREALERWVGERSAVEAARLLRACGVPAQELLSAADLRGDPHLRARGFFEIVALDGEVQELEGVRVRFSDTPAHVRLPPPAPGEQTAAVLRDLLRLDDAEIERLSRAGVVGGGVPAAQ